MQRPRHGQDRGNRHFHEIVRAVRQFDGAPAGDRPPKVVGPHHRRGVERGRRAGGIPSVSRSASRRMGNTCRSSSMSCAALSARHDHSRCAGACACCAVAPGTAWPRCWCCSRWQRHRQPALLPAGGTPPAEDRRILSARAQRPRSRSTTSKPNGPGAARCCGLDGIGDGADPLRIGDAGDPGRPIAGLLPGRSFTDARGDRRARTETRGERERDAARRWSVRGLPGQQQRTATRSPPWSAWAN